MVEGNCLLGKMRCSKRRMADWFLWVRGYSGGVGWDQELGSMTDHVLSTGILCFVSFEAGR